ncbi:MAG: hypothetical protein AB8G17_15535 [Gammaproteobacteria bacterium]
MRYLKVTATLACFMLTTPLYAATLYVDDDATGDGSGSSWSNALNRLDDAMSQARSGDQTWVANGLYKPFAEFLRAPDPNATFSLVGGVALYGGFVGTESSLAERDAGNRKSVLSCDFYDDDPAYSHGSDLTRHDPLRQDNCFTVVTADPPVSAPFGRDTIIDGFTLSGGHARDVIANGYDGGIDGGGLFAGEYGGITARNILFESNFAGIGGGGSQQFGDVLIEDSYYLKNSSCDGGGAGSGHHLKRVAGGELRNVVFEKNYAACFGGGFAFYESNAQINGCVAFDNWGVTHGGGGAIVLSFNYTNLPAVPVTISNCLVYENTSWGGGGIGVINSAQPAAPPTLANLTIINNESTFSNASYGGGGLFLDGGGGLGDGGPVLVSNSILWGNEAANNTRGDEIFTSTDSRYPNLVTVVDHSYVFDYVGGVTVRGKPPVFGPTSSMFGDAGELPGFVDAAAQDFHLASQSILVDQGDPSLDYSGQLDFEGDARVMGACTAVLRADIGADERIYPTSWCSLTQCYGDADENGSVNFLDVSAFNSVCQSANGGCSIAYPDPSYAARVDFNHDGVVDVADWSILTQNFSQAPSQDCAIGDPFP